MKPFDRNAHENTRDVLEKEKAAAKYDAKHKTEKAKADEMAKTLLDGGKIKFEKGSIPTGFTIELAQNRIKQAIQYGKPESKPELISAADIVAVNLSIIIALNTLKDRKNVTPQMEDEAIENVRETRAFAYLKKDCARSWENLVKYSTDACKGNGSELMLDFAKINRKIKAERSSDRNAQPELDLNKGENKGMGGKK